jgi:dTDP-4-amino-4,6-dideoxygalactose transaminase
MTPQAEYSRLFSTYITGGTGFPFWKGRVALYAILRALHIGPGDEVIVPGYTCVMNVNPILYVGARPKYADIDPDNYNLTLASVKSHVTDRTRAVIAQHTYGFPAPIVELLDYATRRGIHVIEDCCLALGSTCQGRLLGSFGVASYFSSQWS